MATNDQPTKMWPGCFRTITFVGFLIAGVRFAMAQQIMRPEGQELSLRGTIRLVRSFGPPGFGEDRKHDAHVAYWALEVPVPVNTPCIPEKPEWAKYDCRPAKRLNLYFDGMALTRFMDLPAAKWKDRRVIVRGKLHRADTLSEMTPIYMDVASISEPVSKERE